MTNRKKMADDYSNTNGKAGWTFEVITFVVAGGKHGEDKFKRDQELHNQGMTHRDTWVHLIKDRGQEEVWWYIIQFRSAD